MMEVDQPIRWVLDASALLALLHQEEGSQHVESALRESGISSVNWSEVIQKALARGADIVGLRSDLEALGLRIVAFCAADAETAASLWLKTRQHGFSLGDRACLALGLVHRCPILTADREWGNLDLGVDIQLIR